MACWYTFAPEAAALRAAWGEYPDVDALEAWPGFVQVTARLPTPKAWTRKLARAFTII